MNLIEFNEFAKDRILQAVITVEGKKFPLSPIKYPPLCYLYLDDLSIKIKENSSFLLITKKKLVGEIKYKDIQSVKVSAVHKLSNFVSFAVGKVLFPEFVFILKDGNVFHFDCESINVIPGVIRQLTKKKVKIYDPLEIVDKFNKGFTDEEFLQDLGIYIEEVIKKKGIDLLRKSSKPNMQK
ncbi:hypothetical protein [Heyndrickxia vini]|uniref:Uncharacterized protein n=1 Tax=Heyndrickxia vini TaxID=1476025 RepID=A0ABX7DZD8_9BACI|nr:hypothetical protein [Heyndrickxia vini]QQZ08458.1 hypothetical protein I5776_15500 [Heyndrickxia vini]